MEQIQRTEHNVACDGNREITNRISVHSIDEVAEVVDEINKSVVPGSTRPQGQSKRKWHNQGADFYFFNCACGKLSGNMYCKKRFNLWLRLHKKKCSLH